MRHTEGDCPLCRKKLEGAHVYLRDWFYRVKAREPSIHVSWAWRGPEDQAKLKSEGASNASFPNSPHNHQTKDGPCSLALDLFQIDADGQARFSGLFMAKIWAKCEADKEPFIWGGYFKKPAGDFCHFELDRKKLQIV